MSVPTGPRVSSYNPHVNATKAVADAAFHTLTTDAVSTPQPLRRLIDANNDLQIDPAALDESALTIVLDRIHAIADDPEQQHLRAQGKFLLFLRP